MRMGIVLYMMNTCPARREVKPLESCLPFGVSLYRKHCYQIFFER